jgi:hypothetical protein
MSTDRLKDLKKIAPPADEAQDLESDKGKE